MPKTSNKGRERPADEPAGGSGPSRSGPSRSVPQQARSRRRYASIVDSAAQLFATTGFDGTTMDAIAAGAETSIGSVYRFFPDKRAIFRAVADLAMATVDQAFRARIVAAAPGAQWHELLDLAVDVFTEIHEREMAARALLANIQLYDEYAEADRAQQRQIAAVTEGLLGVWAPELEPEARAVVAAMIVQTVFGMIVLSQREPPARRAAMVEHCKLMLRRYLSPWIETPGTIPP